MDKERLEKYFYENVASVFWSSILLISGYSKFIVRSDP